MSDTEPYVAKTELDQFESDTVSKHRFLDMLWRKIGFRSAEEQPEISLGRKRVYRAITRHSDGRIIHVRDIQATSDAEAAEIVSQESPNIRIDLWSDTGLVKRFAGSNS